MGDVIVISVDDLTYWAGPTSIFSGQIKAPNIQRLAAEGVSFSNAYTPEAICNPARSSFWSGLSPDQTGIHANSQVWYETIDPAATLTAQFKNAGYDVGGYGKLTHSLALPNHVAATMYDVFVGKMGYDGTDTFGPLPGDIPPEQLSDHITIDNAIGFLRAHDASDPFMLNVGLVKPHLNWVVPQEYFDLYPLDQIEVPGLVGDDMSNVPAFIRDQLVDSRGHQVPNSVDEARKFLQGYFASLSYADAQIGRLFDELDATGRWDDTTIVLWSDHGYHLGDRDNLWGKFTLWEEATKVPLVFKLPGDAEGGRVVDDVVNLVDVYPTLLDLEGIGIPGGLSGDSLKSLLLNTGPAAGDGMSVTFMFGSVMLRTATHAYIHYEDGSQELYDMIADPQQINNLAGQAGQASLLAQLRGLAFDKANIVADAGGVAVGTTANEVFLLNDAGDVATGGAGDDSYHVNRLGVAVVEVASGGRDTVFTRVDFALPDHVENLAVSRYNGPGVIRLTGNALNNILTGSAGAEVMFGGEGDDKLRGGHGADTLYGGNGNDTLVGAAQADLMFGGEGVDTFYGGGGDDTLHGEAGQDTFILAGGGAQVFGGAGNDLVYINAGTAVIDGGAGADRITATGAAQVIASYQTSGAAVRVSLALSGVNTGDAAGDLHLGVIGLAGSGFNDTLEGNAVANQLQGGAGNDHLSGLDGNDTLRGGAGADVLDGGLGLNIADYTGSAAVRADLLDPAGNTGDAAGDSYASIQGLTGGAGDDTLLGDAGANAIAGAEGADHLSGRDGKDTLRGDAGSDRLQGGTGADLLDGGAGIDTAVYLGLNQRVDMIYGGASTGEALGDTLTGIENILGGAGRDTILGSDQSNLLEGAEGNDQLSGRGGNDTLLGGAGDDVLFGDLGADVLNGGAGFDVVHYGLGGAVLVDLSQPGLNSGAARGDSLIGIEAVSGSAFGDRLLGSAGADRFDGLGGHDLLFGREGNDLLKGAAGDDTLFGGAGADFLIGGAGIDRVVYSGAAATRVDLLRPGQNTGEAAGDRFAEVEIVETGTGHDTIAGSDGAETLNGRSGHDIISGRGGADVLQGGFGDDTLTGGTGADVFEFRAGADVITDWSATDGDRIVISPALLATPLTTAQIVATYASLVAAGVLFDFGAGNRLLLQGVQSLDGLADQLLLA